VHLLATTWLPSTRRFPCTRQGPFSRLGSRGRAGLVAERDLFVSTSLADSPRIAASIVAEGYDVVMWGGGDGTFANGVAEVVAASARAGRAVPEMGCVRLGTGNAIADTIGAAPATPAGIADDLRRARAERSARQLPMLDVEGRPGLFCGFGLDAQILDDLGKTLRGLDKVGLADKIRSAGARYFISVTSRSIPRFLTASRPEILTVPSSLNLSLSASFISAGGRSRSARVARTSLISSSTSVIGPKWRRLVIVSSGPEIALRSNLFG